MNHAAYIEKNRLKLARMINCCLILAYLCRFKHTALPARISAWVEELIFKAEAATGFLLIVTCGNEAHIRIENAVYFAAARAIHEGTWQQAQSASTPMQIGEIIVRLKALRCAIRRVRSANAKQLQATGLCQHPHMKNAHIFAHSLLLLPSKAMASIVEDRRACAHDPPRFSLIQTNTNFALDISAKL